MTATTGANDNNSSTAVEFRHKKSSFPPTRIIHQAGLTSTATWCVIMLRGPAYKRAAGQRNIIRLPMHHSFRPFNRTTNINVLFDFNFIGKKLPMFAARSTSSLVLRMLVLNEFAGGRTDRRTRFDLIRPTRIPSARPLARSFTRPVPSWTQLHRLSDNASRVESSPNTTGEC